MPGERVILTELPPGLIDGLPIEDQQAICEVVGQPLQLTEYFDDGRVELEFRDRFGVIHFIYVDRRFVRPADV